jgi:hypothetical protein
MTEGARRLGEPLESYLRRLMDAGLKTLPGTAAEILDDEIRAVLCPDKISTEEWLEAHRTAHRVGLRSNVTIMFGAVERPVHWARHLLRTRDLQRETGGFTELVPLPFVHMATPIYLQHRARRGPTFREALLVHAVGRIAYAGAIPNVQASWVKLGPDAIPQLLAAGCNDLGGTLMDENISRAAGATHGQLMTPEDFRRIIEPLGRPVEQRKQRVTGRMRGQDGRLQRLLKPRAAQFAAHDGGQPTRIAEGDCIARAGAHRSGDRRLIEVLGERQNGQPRSDLVAQRGDGGAVVVRLETVDQQLRFDPAEHLLQSLDRSDPGAQRGHASALEDGGEGRDSALGPGANDQRNLVLTQLCRLPM